MRLNEFMTRQRQADLVMVFPFSHQESRNLKTTMVVTSVTILNPSQICLIPLYQHF